MQGFKILNPYESNVRNENVIALIKKIYPLLTSEVGIKKQK